MTVVTKLRTLGDFVDGAVHVAVWNGKRQRIAQRGDGQPTLWKALAHNDARNVYDRLQLTTIDRIETSVVQQVDAVRFHQSTAT